jgi:hypothetical protein
LMQRLVEGFSFAAFGPPTPLDVYGFPIPIRPQRYVPRLAP